MKNENKAKNIDIEPKTGDVLLNWNKNKTSQKEEVSNVKVNQDNNIKDEKQAKGLDVELNEGEVFLNWNNHKRSPRTFDQIKQKAEERLNKHKELPKTEPIKAKER